MRGLISIKLKRIDSGTRNICKKLPEQFRKVPIAFIRHSNKVIASIAVVVAFLLVILVSWYTGVAFVIGALMSGSAGWVGMKIATLANVRVANTARITQSMGKTLKIAFQGGSVMGLSVGGFALLGLGLVYFVFGTLLHQTDPEQITVITNWLGINFIPFSMTVSGYALGCSVIAMFDRVEEGKFTRKQRLLIWELISWKNRSPYSGRRS